MSSNISTRAELSSSCHSATGTCWRWVEAQNQISTTKITDSADEQEVLELLIEESKPPIPPECRHLHFLLATPFRYGAPYPRGSRFRKAGFTPGVYYSSDSPHVVIAELCFHRLLFFYESPETKWPPNAGEYTVFAADYSVARSIDLTRPPFDSRSAAWMHPTRYDECQELAGLARTAGVELIKYASVRDPRHRMNVAILSCSAFASPQPGGRQTWRILLGSNGARALCEMPRETLDFNRDVFRADPRIQRMRWDR
jgi:RES domain